MFENYIAEIGRLNMIIKEKDNEISSYKALLKDLRDQKIIDHLNRKLPLPHHNIDCPYGQTGCLYCTC